MVAAGEMEAEGGWVLKPGGAQTEEMGAADVEQLRGSIGVEIALVEGVKGLAEERQGEALEKLVFCKGPLDAGVARRARLFVGLRYAPASSKPGPAGEEHPAQAGRRIVSLILFSPAVSFCSRPDRKYYKILFSGRAVLKLDRTCDQAKDVSETAAHFG